MSLVIKKQRKNTNTFEISQVMYLVSIVLRVKKGNIFSMFNHIQTFSEQKNQTLHDNVAKKEAKNRFLCETTDVNHKFRFFLDVDRNETDGVDHHIESDKFQRSVASLGLGNDVIVECHPREKRSNYMRFPFCILDNSKEHREVFLKLMKCEKTKFLNNFDVSDTKTKYTRALRMIGCTECDKGLFVKILKTFV